MWRLNGAEGAIAVLTALLLAVLLGIAALVLDVGSLAERGQRLQGGTDAAALAAARLCAAATCSEAAAAAQALVAGNLVGPSAVTTVTPLSNSVRVTSSSVAALNFAGVLGVSEREVVRASTAAWGASNTGRTAPFGVANCVYTHATAAGLPSGPITIYKMNSYTGPSPHPTPGCAPDEGFDWLATNNEAGIPPCRARVTLPVGETKRSPGNQAPPDCSVADLTALVGQVVPIPVFAGHNGLTGSNRIYTLRGFGAFEVTGYYLGVAGLGSPAGHPAGSPPCSGSQRCIRGRFTTFYNLGEAPVPGLTSLGYVTIGLTG
jgi:Flp pilus assembly protein TadG